MLIPKFSLDHDLYNNVVSDEFIEILQTIRFYSYLLANVIIYFPLLRTFKISLRCVPQSCPLTVVFVIRSFSTFYNKYMLQERASNIKLETKLKEKRKQNNETSPFGKVVRLYQNCKKKNKKKL